MGISGAVISTFFAMFFSVLDAFILFDEGIILSDSMNIGSHLLCFAFIAIALLAVRHFNKTADSMELPPVKGAGKTRYVKTALFAVLFTYFITAMIYVIGPTYDGDLPAQRLGFTRFLLTWSCVYAACMYAGSYAKTMPRRLRMQKICRRAVLNGNRRFTLTVESLATDKIYVLVRGRIFGTVRVFDKVLIHQGGTGDSRSRILSIQADGKKVLQATDCEVTIRLNVPIEQREAKHLYKYSIITSIRPLVQTHGELNCESPYLRSLINIFNKCSQDRSYLSMMNYELIHSRYILAGMIAENEKQNHPGDIMDPLMKNSNVQFPGIFQKDHPEKQMLAVFTDWDAVSRWKSAMKEERTTVMIADFSQVIAMTKKGFTGAVINPFGPGSFYVSIPLMDSIRQLQGYKEEFLQEKNNGN